MFFDGSDVGVGGVDVDAVSLQPDGSILLSFDAAITLGSLGAVADADIVRFVPTSTGSTTAGDFEWYFDGSDVGLTNSSEDIDAVGFTPDGQLVISTEGAVAVTGVSGADEDLLVFTATQLGATTSGTWAMYFDGSDVGLSTTASEDINGAWIDAGHGKIYLTTLGAFSVDRRDRRWRRRVHLHPWLARPHDHLHVHHALGRLGQRLSPARCWTRWTLPR